MPHLEFSEGESLLFVHQLRPGRTLIGRSDRCDVALPSERVSRVHCLVEQRGDGWWLVNRSRNGLRLNGQEVQRHRLEAGDRVDLGDYVARFDAAPQDPSLSETTTATPVRPALHEDLVGACDSVARCRATLVFTRGPHEERTILLERPRLRVGGPGADIELDDELPRTALSLRVVRGRVMLEPGRATCFLAGTRVRELTPAQPGEEVRIGPHGFRLDMQTQEDHRLDLTSFGPLVGHAKVMRKLFGILHRMALHDAAVLITGASGTGKELAARALHEAGPRHGGPFVAVNCAAIAENLFESELFGHEKGAFTGATDRQDGAFQRAHQGTLFLDEVGELRLDDQAKLLRALESGEVRRVGGKAPEFPDIRLVAATNRDLSQMVEKGAFRADLYFRLAVLTVRMPSLCERPEDIPLLASTLLERNHPGATLLPDASATLQRYRWPGNVREMRNVLTRAYVLGGPVISARSLQFNPCSFEETPPPEPPGDETERRLIAEALDQHDGNKSRAARELGIPRSSFLYRLKRYGLG